MRSRSIMYRCFFVLVIYMTTCFQGPKGDFLSAEENQSPKENMKLIWSDEFDYPDAQLDKNWNAQNGPSGHILCSRWRENAIVKDGTLRLCNKKETRGGQSWTSASLTSKEQFQYGYFECRYRYAAAQGTNNSFWLMTIGDIKSNNTNAKRFEIDINEGHYPNEINMNIHNWSDIIDVKGKKRHPTSHKAMIPQANLNLAKEFHVYGLLWTEKDIVFYFDNKEIRRVENKFCYSKSPVWLSEAIINWAGPVTDAIDGTWMEVDYVRIYQ